MNIVKNNTGTFSAGNINVGTINCSSIFSTGDIFGSTVSATTGEFRRGGDRVITNDAETTYIYHDDAERLRTQVEGVRVAGDITMTGGDLRHDNGEAILSSVENGSTTLYHDNSAKIATTSSGISVTGTAASTTVVCGTVSCGTVDSITGTFSRDNERIITNDSATTYVYYNDAEKFRTTSSGISVTNTVACSTLTATGAVSGASANFAGTVQTGDIQTSTGDIKHDNGEFILASTQDGSTQIYYNNSERYRTTGGGFDWAGGIGVRDRSGFISRRAVDYSSTDIYDITVSTDTTNTTTSGFVEVIITTINDTNSNNNGMRHIIFGIIVVSTTVTPTTLQNNSVGAPPTVSIVNTSGGSSISFAVRVTGGSNVRTRSYCRIFGGENRGAGNQWNLSVP
jgi:hypothetical protein